VVENSDVHIASRNIDLLGLSREIEGFFEAKGFISLSLKSIPIKLSSSFSLRRTT
jgi:hypothetical protein